MSDSRYPIGKYEPQPFSEKLKQQWLADIRFLPNALENAIINLSEQQLQTPYRDGGWTVHQVVHHVADSHMNAYCRFKLGYTENKPAIKPYDENAWAKMDDVKNLPVNVSITLLYAVHQRLFEFLNSLADDDWQNKSVFHPEHNKEMTLWYLLGMYSWHGRHHTAHITSLREVKGW
jgi:uncharacterized damage-inducible protein DinB